MLVKIFDTEIALTTVFDVKFETPTKVMIMSGKVAPILSVCVFLAASAQADLILSDSFNTSSGGDDAVGIYEAGPTPNILGQSPNTLGFDPANAWAINSNGAEVISASSTGLTSPVAGYGHSGGSVLHAVNGRFGYSTTRGVGHTFGINQPSTLWFSFLINVSDTSGGRTADVNFTRDNSDGGAFDFGITGTEYSVTYRDSGSNSESLTTGAGYVAGETALLVMQLNINSAGGDDDDWFLYLNPAMGAAPFSTDAILSGTGTIWDSDTELGAVQPRVGGSAGQPALGDWTVDEIRIATSFDAIPEPGTYALLSGLLALGAVMVRRRK